MTSREWSNIGKHDIVPESELKTAFATALGTGRSLNRYSNVLANEKTLFPSASCFIRPKHVFDTTDSESSPDKTPTSSQQQKLEEYPYLCANAFKPSQFNNAPHTFIACQAPIPKQIETFWQTVLQYEVPLIMMLTKVKEGGHHKADTYWPAATGVALSLPSTGISLEMIESSVQKEAEIATKTFKVSKGNISHLVKHVQYLGWPDFGVPNDPKTFEHLVEICEATDPTKGPIVVHCSAGIGRTGTLMGVYYGRHLLQQRKKKLGDESLRTEVIDIICTMKKTRTGMVQRIEQFQFILKCLGLKSE